MKSPDAPINEDEEFKMAVELSFWHRVYMYLSGRGYQRNACGQMATHIDRLFDEYSMTKELEATVIEDNLRIAELEQELADNQYQIDILVKEGDKEIKRLREALEHIAAADPFSIRIAKQALEGRDE